MSRAVLVALNDLPALQAAGIRYPQSLDAWRWMYRVRAKRGLERAFVRQGRRVLVDVPAYLKAVRSESIDGTQAA